MTFSLPPLSIFRTYLVKRASVVTRIDSAYLACQNHSTGADFYYNLAFLGGETLDSVSNLFKYKDEIKFRLFVKSLTNHTKG